MSGRTGKLGIGIDADNDMSEEGKQDVCHKTVEITRCVTGQTHANIN